jgi:deoxyadenosine/deoxycytidine kinase
VTAGPVPTGKVTLTSAVSEEYKSPFSFKGRIEQVKIELK